MARRFGTQDTESRDCSHLLSALWAAFGDAAKSESSSRLPNRTPPGRPQGSLALRPWMIFACRDAVVPPLSERGFAVSAVTASALAFPRLESMTAADQENTAHWPCLAGVSRQSFLLYVDKNVLNCNILGILSFIPVIF